MYLGNVLRLVLATLGRSECFGETYNIADPEPVTLKAFAAEVAGSLGLPVPRRHIPRLVGLALGALARVYKALRLSWRPPLTPKQLFFLTRNRRIDSGKAYALLGGVPHAGAQALPEVLASL